MARGQNPWLDVANYLGSGIAQIFDVGANVGQTSRTLHATFPAARIYSFEPVVDTFQVLVANSKAFDRIVCMNFGFSDRPATREIFLQENSEWNSLEHNVNRGRGTTKIKTETIDEFCAEHAITTIDLLKTDTEGHDLSVLRGAVRMLTERRISAVYSEVGFYREDSQHTHFCDLLIFMQTHGFQFHCFYELDLIFYIDHPKQPGFGFTNALFFRNDIIQTRHADQYTALLDKIGRPAN
jgi:FkbM family methyltransferase